MRFNAKPSLSFLFSIGPLNTFPNTLSFCALLLCQNAPVWLTGIKAGLDDQAGHGGQQEDGHAHRRGGHAGHGFAPSVVGAPVGAVCGETEADLWKRNMAADGECVKISWRKWPTSEHRQNLKKSNTCWFRFHKCEIKMYSTFCALFTPLKSICFARHFQRNCLKNSVRQHVTKSDYATFFSVP